MNEEGNRIASHREKHSALAMTTLLGAHFHKREEKIHRKDLVVVEAAADSSAAAESGFAVYPRLN